MTENVNNNARALEWKEESEVEKFIEAYILIYKFIWYANLPKNKSKMWTEMCQFNLMEFHVWDDNESNAGWKMTWYK